MAQRGEDKVDGSRLQKPHPNLVPEASRVIQAHIGDRLRRMFDEVVEEPIPDKLKLLLDNLEKTGES